MFRVTLVNLTEHTKDSWEYNSLLDALKVAKNVDTSTRDDLMARPAMTDEFFDKHLAELLIMGFIHVRDDVIVNLWRLDKDGIVESPVMDGQVMFTGKVTIPSSRLPVDETNIVRGRD